MTTVLDPVEITDPVALAVEIFHQQYDGEDPAVVVRAPGRVNLIGEHTDYNGGFVLPMALERYTVMAARPRGDGMLNAYSRNLDRRATTDLTTPARSREEPWLDYMVGVAAQLQDREIGTSGCDVVVVSNVPMSSGVSSSAALEMAALSLFEVFAGVSLETAEAAELGQRVENDFLGLSSGIMDQFIVRGAQAEHAMFLDCSSLAFEHIPVLFDDCVFVVADTNCPRRLTHSEYNQRVQECAEAVHLLNLRLGRKERALRAFSLEDLEHARDALPEVVLRRARHVLSENGRTRDAAEALHSGDAIRFGQLMNESHESLREDYEVTSRELDALSEIARTHPACRGARMTGAGFGGCTVSLVQTARVAEFIDTITRGYRDAVGLDATCIVSRPAAGAGPVSFGAGIESA